MARLERRRTLAGFRLLTREEIQDIVAQVRTGLSALYPGEGIEAILFGSYARGDAEPDSDLDIMFLVDASREEIAVRSWDLGGLVADFLIDRGVVVALLLKIATFSG